jgi:predicted unusual protein kinase regulating ubiquinone biosynthesis (AarF/ABC1/UbiB family)
MGVDDSHRGSRGRSKGNRTGLGGRIGRGTDLAKLSASTGASFMSSRVRGLGGDASEADERFHTETAERMLELFGSMKGAAMKLGQIASFVDLDLPPEVQETYHEVLGELRDAAPPMDPETIAQVVREDFGGPPEQVFHEWQPEPLASASIGQVHRARLPDGTAVVVKVQYPEVAEAVRSDLANAESFAPLAKLISPNLDLGPLLEEMRDRLVDELDYQREAEYQQAFHDRYDGHPFIRVPKVFAEYSRPRVITSEYVEGADFETMLASSTEAQRQRYGEIIYRFVFGSVNRFRLFNGDPHPGNYLFPGDGSVVFLDFGSVKAFRRQTRTDIKAQLGAIIDHDTERLIKTMDAAGFLPADSKVDPDQLMAWFRQFNEPVLADAEWTYTPEFAREVIRTVTDPRAGYIDMLRRLNLPPDYLLLNRIQWGVNSILGRLRARANWRRIAGEFWDGDPPATDLGATERPFIEASPYLA